MQFLLKRGSFSGLYHLFPMFQTFWTKIKCEQSRKSERHGIVVFLDFHNYRPSPQKLRTVGLAYLMDKKILPCQFGQVSWKSCCMVVFNIRPRDTHAIGILRKTVSHRGREHVEVRPLNQPNFIFAQEVRKKTWFARMTALGNHSPLPLIYAKTSQARFHSAHFRWIYLIFTESSGKIELLAW